MLRLKWFWKDNRKKILVVSIMVIIIIALITLFIQITKPTASELALEDFKYRFRYTDDGSLEGVVINYFFHTDHYYIEISGTDEGVVKSQDEINAVRNFIRTIEIDKKNEWDKISGYAGGGEIIKIIAECDDGAVFVFESNTQAHRYTLTTPNGEVYKESCTFDYENLLSFLLTHDAKD